MMNLFKKWEHHTENGDMEISLVVVVVVAVEAASDAGIFSCSPSRQNKVQNEVCPRPASPTFLHGEVVICVLNVTNKSTNINKDCIHCSPALECCQGYLVIPNKAWPRRNRNLAEPCATLAAL